MNTQAFYSKLQKPNTTKIVLVVADGLGGIPMTPGGKTELETAIKPNLDKLAAENTTGLSIPVIPGIAPGSGPGHLGLFGYDATTIEAGRGVLEVLGTDFDLRPDDVALRGNFCSVDAEGNITDRRAGRIPTTKCAELVEKLKAIKIDGVELLLEPVQDYRFALIIRGANLGGDVEDTDPQKEGGLPLPAKAKNAESEQTAAIVNEFVKQAKEILKNDHPANMITFRGIGKKPHLPTMQEAYGLKAAAISIYPMYRGVSRLVGMTILQPGKNFGEQIDVMKQHWNEFDFFFLHYKYTDAMGEDGNFDGKVKKIEELDSYIPSLLEANPDVLIVTGDHSSPAALKAHSWHPLPTILAAKTCIPDLVTTYGERACMSGGLGQFESKYLMPLALAHALRLKKYGA